MSHKISYIFIFLIVIVFVIGGFLFYRSLFQNIKDPVTLVPDHASLIVEIPDFKKFNEDWDSSYVYNKFFDEWPSLQEYDQILPQVLQHIQVKTENFALWEIPSLLLSFHHHDWLLILPSTGVSPGEMQDELLPYISPKPVFKEKEINGEWLAELSFSTKTIFLTENKGWYFVSSSSKLALEALNLTQKPNTFTQSGDFQELLKVSGKRSDAHVYLNFQELQSLLPLVANDSEQNIWKRANSIALWAGLDLSINANEIFLNGYSIPQKNSTSFLSILENQKSVGMTISDHFPYGTSGFYHLSISDYNMFLQRWNGYMQSTGLYPQILRSGEQIQKQLTGKIAELTNKWWAGEMACLQTDRNKLYGVFLAKKGPESFLNLSEIAHLSQPEIISLEYKNYKIKEINFPWFMAAQFGPWFKNFEKTYFTVVDDMAIFAQNTNDLMEYVDILEQGYILQKNESYIAFSDNLSKNSNFTYFLNSPKTPLQILPGLDELLVESLSSCTLFKNDLSGFSTQLTWKNNMVYTSLYGGFDGKRTQNTSQWQVLLDSEMILSPSIITDHTDGTHKYIVFDDFRQMYLIDEQGDVVWKKQLEENAMSPVHQIDFYKNGKIQYLFNTENYVYLVDLTGELVDNYPVKLNSEASAGLSVVDYSNNKDYRIFIPCKNGEIYNYQINGRLVKDWKAKNTRRKIVKPIKHLVIANKDYLIAEADNGNVFFYDRKGNIRMEIKQSFQNALGSDFYSGQNTHPGHLLTTSADGKIAYIPEKGAIKSDDFGKFSPNHFFLYDQFNSAAPYNFIFVDGQQLQVFDKDKNPVYTYVFEHEIVTKPQMFNISGDKILTVLDSLGGQLYLFDSKGFMSKTFEGSLGYTFDSSNSRASVIIANDRSVSKYDL
jgi:hypothetical protein